MSVIILGLLIAALILAGISVFDSPKSTLPWAVLIVVVVLLAGRL